MISMDALDRVMKKSGAAAYAMIGSSEYADMRYLTRFITTDPILYVRRVGERGWVVVSQMEYTRAQQEALTMVMTRADAGLFRFLEEEKDRWRALARMIAELAEGKILIPPDFPYVLGYHLETLTGVIPDTGTVVSMRARKSRREVLAIEKVQHSAERAMAHAIDSIRRSKSRNGMLWLGDKLLTSERLRSEMHVMLMHEGCSVRDTILSCGRDTAIPHNKGAGLLIEGEPIVIDIFPRSEQTGYHSDMSRTVVKGEPGQEIGEMFDAVKTAQDLAASLIKPGVTGEEVHQAVVDLFASRGYGTKGEGFIHNLGHGVGLEVHELPSLGPGGGPLKRGNVITNEPGLYYAKVGGVRLEDIGVVTRTGYRTITELPRELVI
jgi:Xaa-Pro aminopeptidase